MENQPENVQDDNEAFIWSHMEAYQQQVEQIGQSACGATAILNIFKALKFDYDFDKVCSLVIVNKRIPESDADKTSLGEYLFSRSKAGMNARELIENTERASESKISGRLFAFNPKTSVNISSWMSKWIEKGAVPVALLNLQKTPINGCVPDAWHHQMIYGCDSNFIYLTNPLEFKTIKTIMTELSSDSVLLVRNIDILKRFTANKYDLSDLIKYQNFSEDEKKRWLDINVYGQVTNALKTNLGSEINETLFHEPISGCSHNDLNLSHISIPASYIPGITLFAFKNSSLFDEILRADELN